MLALVCARLLRITLPATLGLTLALPVCAAADDQDEATVEVHGGTVVFDVATNVSAISVHGKSTALDGRARVRQTDGGLAIEQIEASVPIASLATGMGLRDAHMRKYVFTTPGGQTPDLRFEASQADCARAGSGGRDMTCQMTGTLAIRGTARPFAMTLRVSESGGGALHANGDVNIKLSAWQIDPPSQLGVQTSDDVKLHVDFAARPAPNVMTTAYRSGR